MDGNFTLNNSKVDTWAASCPDNDVVMTIENSIKNRIDNNILDGTEIFNIYNHSQTYQDTRIKFLIDTGIYMYASENINITSEVDSIVQEILGISELNAGYIFSYSNNLLLDGNHGKTVPTEDL